jgi:hypothetical protein
MKDSAGQLCSIVVEQKIAPCVIQVQRLGVCLYGSENLGTVSIAEKPSVVFEVCSCCYYRFCVSDLSDTQEGIAICSAVVFNRTARETRKD